MFEPEKSQPADNHAPPSAGGDGERSWQQTRQEWIDRFTGWLDTVAETEAGRERLRQLDFGAPTGPAAAIGSASGSSAAHRTAADDGLAGLLDVVGSLTALRHELKLQTKSSRALTERVGADAERFEASAERIVRAMERVPDVDPDQLTRPLIDSLVDFDEAVGRLREAIDALAAEWPSSPPSPPHVSLWGRKSVAAAWGSLADVWSVRHRRLAGLAEGVRLLCSRIEGHLAEHRIERIGRLGEAVDPHTMEVLEVVADSDAAAGTVARVLRPGYRRGERVIRAAQVAAVGSTVRRSNL